MALVSCKKDDNAIVNTHTPVDNYSSIDDFFSKNQPAMQEYTINGALGGSFTTPQGTIVTIPANAFVSQTSLPVTGDVTIQFKDIYLKSDMLLQDKSTMLSSGRPLKSGGEFFIKAVSDNAGLLLADGKNILVEQPATLTGGVDTVNVMTPFVQGDTAANIAWVPSIADTVIYSMLDYIYSLYQFSVPADSGTWCNSDNATFFSMYSQTNLTMIPNDSTNIYGTQVFLVFKDISSMVHVYQNSFIQKYNYYFYPVGLESTMVAIGVKDGTLYTSFIPITGSGSMTLNFSLSETTTAEFLSELEALN